MFEAIQRLYESTKNKQVVINAVLKKYITEEEYFKITGDFFE